MIMSLRENIDKEKSRRPNIEPCGTPYLCLMTLFIYTNKVVIIILGHKPYSFLVHNCLCNSQAIHENVVIYAIEDLG